jgi:hypothetical protein
MTDLTAFPLFASLPAELRLKIYAHATPSPTLIPVRFSTSSPTPHYYTTLPLCPLLSTTRESRQLYLRTHTLLSFSEKYPSCIYIDFENDTLFFDNLDCSPDGDLAHDLESCPQRDRISKIAIDVCLWEVLRVFRFECLSEVKALTNLKSLALVLRRERERSAHEVRGGMGIGHVVVEGANTVEQEIMNVRWYAESLRWEIEHVEGSDWTCGKPNVQIWLW